MNKNKVFYTKSYSFWIVVLVVGYVVSQNTEHCTRPSTVVVAYYSYIPTYNIYISFKEQLSGFALCVLLRWMPCCDDIATLPTTTTTIVCFLRGAHDDLHSFAFDVRARACPPCVVLCCARARSTIPCTCSTLYTRAGPNRICYISLFSLSLSVPPTVLNV